MSNALTSLVPVLNGTNYQEWTKVMKAYLMSMDLWEYTNGDEKQPTQSSPPTQDEKITFKAWKSANQKALANIILWVKPSIREDIVMLNNVETIWNCLKSHFNVVQPTTLFKDFKATISIWIDATKHPLPQVNRLQAVVQCLSNNGVSIPKIIQVMILLSALPPKWEMLISILCTNYDLAHLQLKHVCEVIMAQWEAERTKGKPQQSVQKLSAVKHKHGDPNYRQQCNAGSGGGSGNGSSNSQQFGQGQGNAQGKKKCGKCGRKKSQQHKNSHESNDHSHLASQATLPPPTTTTIAHFASKGKTVRMVCGHTRLLPATVGQYPTLNKACDIVRDIGVVGTSNTLKTLKECIATLESEDSDDDQCTHKHSRSSMEPSEAEEVGVPGFPT